MEAVIVLHQARSFLLEEGLGLEHALVATGEPGSRREKVLRGGILAVTNSISTNIRIEYANQLLVGPKGIGKTSLFKALLDACAIIQFANPEVDVCPAYVK